MENLLERLSLSVKHLKCLDEVFRANSTRYAQMEQNMIRELGHDYNKISHELYAGGKQQRGLNTLNRQMILGDVIEYIFTGRAYYYAARSEDNFKKFSTLVLYCVNQLLFMDTITVNPAIRRAYINKLEQEIDPAILYEKAGDRALANALKRSNILIWQPGWKQYDTLVDSLLPKTLGCPKELVVFLELVRMQKGLVIPLLLIQRLFGGTENIAPPDFLLLKRNREVFGIEVGYKKELQSRKFSAQTSIPTFAVDMANHMHNRCPKCGENILYCDSVIKHYSAGTLWTKLDSEGKYKCGRECQNFDGNICKFANYYGKYCGPYFHGPQPAGDDKENRHYHALCMQNESYRFNRAMRSIWTYHQNEFFCQIPQVEGVSDL